MSQLNLTIGTYSFPGPQNVRKALEAAAAAGIHSVDTAQRYHNNESDIGGAHIEDLNFTIHTKTPGGLYGTGSLVPDVLYKKTYESLKKLNVKQVDIFYIHAPDRTETGKLEKWVPVIDKLHKEGAFRRFGVSNFSVEEVKELHDFSKKNGYIVPSVFQGNYNALSRTYDNTLLPVLKELGIVFYAYSPIAGGYLAKSKEQIIKGGEDAGRFTSEESSALGDMYRKMYHRDSFNNALDTWGELAQAEGISRAELAYRWVYYHSAVKPEQGDNVIFGASKVEQIGSTVKGIQNGPLKAETVKAIDGIWDAVKHDSEFVDNFASI